MSKNRPKFGGFNSVFLSAIFVLGPVALYFLAEYQSGVAEMLLVAAFFFSIAISFFLAIRYSESVAFFWLLRWLFESFSTFGRKYRLLFYGLLFMCGAIGYLLKAINLMLGA